MFNNNLNLYKNITVIILFLPSYNKKNNRARMSSLFNSKNNRFDILNSDDNTNKDRNKNKEKNRDKSNVKKQEQEQKEEPRNFNSFKNDSHPFYEDRRNNRRFNERRSVNSKEMEERSKELEKIKKEKEREEALKETNFPDLFQSKPKTEVKTEVKTETNQKSNQPQPIINFLEKVKNNLTKDEKTEAKNIIKPGWLCMEKATNSNHIIYTYGKQTYFPREPVPIDVLNALVKLHEKQVIQYDSLWGEGAYDEQYKSPYYDYEYFDRLDEQYEDEMDRQDQEEREKEREYDNDYHTY